jgi:hypothetical protein
MARNDEAHYTPTPEEIVEECKKIRDDWSKEKWLKQTQAVSWSLPQINDPVMVRGRI